MSLINSTRSGCRDVFRAFLVKDATYDGDLEIPRIMPESSIPNKLILFSKALKSDDQDCWVCFYEDDAAFERLWNNPNRYLPILKQYKGCISPDFSLYRDMPLVMQQWNIYRSRAIGHWLQKNGIPVITNVRWSDERTFGRCDRRWIPRMHQDPTRTRVLRSRPRAHRQKAETENHCRLRRSTRIRL